MHDTLYEAKCPKIFLPMMTKLNQVIKYLISNSKKGNLNAYWIMATM